MKASQMERGQNYWVGGRLMTCDGPTNDGRFLVREPGTCDMQSMEIVPLDYEVYPEDEFVVR